MAEHTPGPWTTTRAKFKVDGEYDYAIGAKIEGRTHCIAEAFARTAENHRPDAAANALLIAAAPDLLKALGTTNTMMQAVAVQLQSWGHEPVVNWRRQFEANAAAIAKATGTPSERLLENTGKLDNAIPTESAT